MKEGEIINENEIVLPVPGSHVVAAGIGGKEKDMKIEDIEKAADEFADREYEYNYIDRNALSKGFYHGAQWRVNIVWNDERKTPNKSDLILVEFPDGRFDIVYFHSIKSWRSMVKRNGTIRWAYLEDLKPDKEK